MKIFSVVFTFALLLLAQHLGARLKRAGLLPAARDTAEQMDTKALQKFANTPFIRL